MKTIEDDEKRGLKSLDLVIKYCKDQANQLPSTNDLDTFSPKLNKSQLTSNQSLLSTVSASSSLVERYLAPDELARAAGAPIQSSVSKAILASNTLSQKDVVRTATATRDTVTDLVAASKVS